MLAELHKCPSLYATATNAIVMCRMSADALRLVVWSVTAEGKSYKAEFGDAPLTTIKEKAGKDFTWEKFFEELQGAFNGNTVSCANGVVDCAGSTEGVKFTFKLEPTTDDGQKALLDSLLHYHHVHVHSKEVEKQIEELGKKEQEVRVVALELEREEQTLKDTIARSKEQDEVNQKRLLELQKELAAAEAAKRQSGEGEVVDDEDEELTLCRVRNPLQYKDHKEYDVELLRLIKSKWLAEQPEKDGVFNKVARPYTTNELEAHTREFTTKQREVLWECLKKVDMWDFDVFQIQTQMSGDDGPSIAFQPHGGALFFTLYALFFRHNCLPRFNIDEQLALNWISVVESGYHCNPYHNSMHAADVLHITHYILSMGGLIKKCNLTPEDTFAALFAAGIHDYDHPGINNSFHVKASTYLATLYNDRSILENRHVSSVFELMKIPKFNILAGMTEEQRRDIRDTVIEMVLATDMGLHGKYVNQFKRRLQENHDLLKKDDVRLALAMAVKMADISNCGRPQNLYLRWSSKIADEFYMQGDKERNLGMPCSPFMDRTQPAMAKGQIAFMNYIVVPLFECISELLPDMRFSVDHTESNKAYWASNDDS